MSAPSPPKLCPISLQHVSYHKNGRNILDGISCQFPPTGVSVIIGPNGAGKSQLLRLLAAWEHPSGGRIVSAHRSVMLISAVPQFLNTTVERNLWHTQFAARIPRAQRRQQRRTVIQACGLCALTGQNALTLSSGQALRLAMAKVMLVAPTLLLLDEPTANLDPEAIMFLEAQLTQLAQSQNVKILIVTHQIPLALRLAQHCLFLDQGRVLFAGTPAQFRDTTALPYRLAQFLAKGY